MTRLQTLILMSMWSGGATVLATLMTLNGAYWQAGTLAVLVVVAGKFTVRLWTQLEREP